MMKYSAFIYLSLLLIMASCSSHNDSPANHSGSYQAISAQGDTLFAISSGAQMQEQRESDLQRAKKAYQSNPDSLKALTNYGQRSVEIGHYREAIGIYTKGIDKHSLNARLYQQRGRQYIVTRHFDKAISDLKKANELTKKDKSNQMLVSDIGYNLGLAQYLKGKSKKAADSFQQSLDTSPGNDMRVKVSYWLYMSLRRAGMDLQAGKILNPINSDMNLTENETYQKLLLVFKGDFEEKSLLDNSKDASEDIIIGYGLGNWHYINSRKKRAQALFQKVCSHKHWDLISYIAAETDLTRLDF